MSAGNVTELILRGKGAWHGLGSIFPQDRNISVWEGFQEANLDFDFITNPLVTVVDGQEIVAARNQAVLRPNPDGEGYIYTATVGNHYELIQTSQIAEALEPLAKRWPLETLGSLDDGELIWVCLNMGDRIINEDDHTKYVFVNSRQDAKGSLNFGIGIVRQVCANTILASERSAISSTRIRHSQGAGIELTVFAKVMENIERRQEELYEQLEAMGRYKLSYDAQKDIIEHTYPLPKLPSKVETLNKWNADHSMRGIEESLDVTEWVNSAERAKLTYEQRRLVIADQREGVGSLLKNFNEDNPKYANTAWAVHNAVTEWADHSKGRNVGRGSMWGNRATVKVRAHDKILYTMAKNN